MPSIATDRPFELLCVFCETKPLNLRKRSRTDSKTGERTFSGEYYSCKCYSLTISLERKLTHANQTETCTRPDLL